MVIFNSYVSSPEDNSSNVKQIEFKTLVFRPPDAGQAIESFACPTSRG